MYEFCERAFSFCAATLWNPLPDSLKNAVCLSSFKSALKTFLFRKFYFLVTRNIIQVFILFKFNLYQCRYIIIFQFYNRLLVSSLYFILLWHVSALRFLNALIKTLLLLLLFLFNITCCRSWKWPILWENLKDHHKMATHGWIFQDGPSHSTVSYCKTETGKLRCLKRPKYLASRLMLPVKGWLTSFEAVLTTS